MDTMQSIMYGFEVALTWQNIMFVFVGVLVGTIIGMLPGLGPISAIAVMIPSSYGMHPASALILMAGVYYGAIFGGSTSSILLNAPGVASTVATSFDGLPHGAARESRKGVGNICRIVVHRGNRCNNWVDVSGSATLKIALHSGLQSILRLCY